MKYLNKFLDKTKEFLQTRNIGFYLILASIVLSIIQIIIYEVGFSATDFIKYKHFSVTLLAVFAIFVTLGLSATKWTERLAPFAMFFMELFSFLMLIKYGYMYFTELFFAGVTWTRITQMYYGYMGSIILYVLIFVISITSFFMKQSKNIERKELANEN